MYSGRMKRANAQTRRGESSLLCHYTLCYVTHQCAPAHLSAIVVYECRTRHQHAQISALIPGIPCTINRNKRLLVKLGSILCWALPCFPNCTLFVCACTQKWIVHVCHCQLNSVFGCVRVCVYAGQRAIQCIIQLLSRTKTRVNTCKCVRLHRGRAGVTYCRQSSAILQSVREGRLIFPLQCDSIVFHVKRENLIQYYSLYNIIWLWLL